MYLLIPHVFVPIHLFHGSATNVRTSPCAWWPPRILTSHTHDHSVTFTFAHWQSHQDLQCSLTCNHTHSSATSLVLACTCAYNAHAHTHSHSHSHANGHTKLPTFTWTDLMLALGFVYIKQGFAHSTWHVTLLVSSFLFLFWYCTCSLLALGLTQGHIVLSAYAYVITITCLTWGGHHVKFSCFNVMWLKDQGIWLGTFCWCWMVLVFHVLCLVYFICFSSFPIIASCCHTTGGTVLSMWSASLANVPLW